MTVKSISVKEKNIANNGACTSTVQDDLTSINRYHSSKAVIIQLQTQRTKVICGGNSM